MSDFVIVKDNFSQAAKPARQFFEKIYRDPRRTPRERFVWDFWNLKDSEGQSQYRHLRTPARGFLPKKIYDSICLELVKFGQSNFGCWSISDPWLSLYLDGCEQELHTDNPHGPWAYVLSLTTADLQGGSTRILRPEILNYWQSQFSRSRGFEQRDLFLQIPPKFNRLVAFDPRLPHGVSRVSGSATDQLTGRLVLHGWFVNPEPYVTGGLEAKVAARAMPQALNENIQAALARVTVPPLARGMLTYELSVAATGRTTKVKALTDSVATSLIGDLAAARKLNHSISLALARTKWPRAARVSKLVLPLVFD